MKHLKINFILIIIGLISCTNQNKGYQINGEIDNAPEGAKIYFVNDHSGMTEDSAVIINDSFSFRGKTPYPQRYSFVYKFALEKFDHFVWVENCEISIKGEWNQLKSVSIQGGQEQDISLGMDEAISFFQPEFNQLLKENKSDSIPLLINKLSKTLADYALKNSNSYVGIEQLYRVRKDLDRETMGTVIKNMTPDIRNSPYGKSLILHYNSPILNEGDMYQDFTASTLAGGSIKISELLEGGKPILIIFGGLGCMQEHGRSSLKQFVKEYGNYIEVLAFVFARNRDEWINDTKFDLGIPLLSDMKGDHSPIKIKYAVQATPTTYLFDKNGTIVMKSLGYGESVNNMAKKLIEK